MEVLIEIAVWVVMALLRVLLEFFAEVILEVGFEAFAHVVSLSARAVSRAATGVKPVSRVELVLVWALCIIVASIAGALRGELSGDRVHVGLFVAIGLTVVMGVAAVFANEPERPESRWRRWFAWWPRYRLVWFATGNAVYALAYYLTLQS